MSNIQELTTYAQDCAKQLGIDKFDIYGSTVEETSVEVDHGVTKQVQASQGSSAIVRVWNAENQVGMTSTTDTDPSGIELALKTAKEASRFGLSENAPDFSPSAQSATPRVDWQQPTPVSVPTLVEKLVKAEQSLIDAHPAITGVPYNGIEQWQGERFYLNSDGAMRQESRAATSIYLSSKTEQAEKKPRSASAFKISRSLKELDIDACLKEVSDKTISHLDYQTISSGKYLVIFSPESLFEFAGCFFEFVQRSKYSR